MTGGASTASSVRDTTTVLHAMSDSLATKSIER